MPDETPVDEASAANAAAEYVVKFNAAHEALRSAAATAHVVGKDTSRPIHEQAAALSLAEDLTRQLSALVTANERVRNITSTPTGPTVAVIKRAIGLAEQLAQLAAQDILAAGRFEAIVGVIVALSELAPPAAAPAAGAEVTSAALVSAASARAKLMLESSAVRWLERMQGKSAPSVPLG